MFYEMNGELAEQHRKRIIQDAENYRKIVAAAGTGSRKKKRVPKTWRLRALNGRAGTWLHEKAWMPRIFN